MQCYKIGLLFSTNVKISSPGNFLPVFLLITFHIQIKLKSLFIFIFIFCNSVLIAQEDPLTFFNKGNELFLNKDYKGAVEAYDKAIALDPNLYYVYAGRAEARAELGAFKEALDDYNIYKKLVEELNLLGDPEILDKRKKLLSIMPNQKDSKPDDLSESMLNSSSELTAADEVKAIYFRGKIKYESSDVNGAISDFTQVINRDSTFEGAYMGRGYAYLKTRNLVASLRDFNTAISLNPNEYNALIGRGETKDKLKLYSQAIEDFTLAITLQPGKYPAFYDRAISYFNQKNFAKAEEDFTSVINLNSKHPKAYFNRAVSRINQSKTTEACLDLKSAQNLGHPQAADYLSKFCK